MGLGRCNGCGTEAELMCGLCYSCEMKSYEPKREVTDGGEQPGESEDPTGLQAEAEVAGVRELPTLRE